jgi:uncharacterized protein (DUF488 family)
VRPAEEFVALLKAHRIKLVADVRTIPRSRHNPQFNREALPAPLEEAGIAYVHMPGLGGLRHPKKDSINTGWRNDSFRGYADYMQTEQFARSVDELLALPGNVAVMCAESVPWRCHRSLIADALTARRIPVWHIMSEKTRNPHKLTAFAKVDGTKVTYPSETLSLFGEGEAKIKPAP